MSNASLTHRQVPPVEWVDDEGLVPQVHDARDPVARLQGGHGPGDELAAAQVADGAVVVAVLDLLEERTFNGK